MKSLIFTSLLLLSACGQVATNEVSVETQLQPYVTRFQQMGQAVGHPVSISSLIVKVSSSLGQPSSGGWVIGQCETGGGMIPTVSLNTYFWNNSGYSNAAREQLMFHELGHCVLGRLHDDGQIALSYAAGTTIVRTIMATYHFGDAQYTLNYNYYVKELFGMNTAGSYITLSGTSQWTNTYASTSASKTYGTVATGLEPTADGSIDGIKCGD